MKKSLTLLASTALLLLVSACGTAGTGAGAGNTSDGGSVSSDDTAQPTPEAPCETQGIPAAAKDLECLNLTSTAGSDATGDLAWLGSDPITLITFPQDDVVRFSTKTPCNTLMGAVEISDTQFTVGPNLAATMMGCQSPQSDYETWTAKFFSVPLDYKVSGDSLILSGANGSVTFKTAG